MNKTVLNVISQMGKLPYGSDGCGGIKELNYQGDKVLPKGTRSICSSAVFEVLWRYFESTGWLSQIGADRMRTLKDWVWVMGNEDPTTNPFFTGVAGGLVELGLGGWVCRSPYSDNLGPHISLGDPSDLVAGDMVQFYDYDEYHTQTYGHSVVVVGQGANNQGDPAVLVYSSENSVNYGHGYDYWTIKHPSSGKYRLWFGSRLRV